MSTRGVDTTGQVESEKNPPKWPVQGYGGGVLSAWLCCPGCGRCVPVGFWHSRNFGNQQRKRINAGEWCARSAAR